MESPVRIRVLIAEDDDVVREILASVVRAEPGFELACTAENADGAIAEAGRDRPDVALIDVRMPGGGPNAARGIKRCSPGTSVLAFSAYDDPLTMREMYEAGADGYIVKGSPVLAIVASIQHVGGAAVAARERRAA